MYAGATAERLYRSEKVPFAFNYVDRNLDVTHDNDDQGDHGTHVSGIAAANRLDSTPVVGVAPDARLLVMKVFGASGGAFFDDILAALEDSIVLGAHAVNVSLGTPAGFSSTSAALMNGWGTHLNLTSDPDNSIISSPSAYIGATSVASSENASIRYPYVELENGTKIPYNDVAATGMAMNMGLLEIVADEPAVPDAALSSAALTSEITVPVNGSVRAELSVEPWNAKYTVEYAMADERIATVDSDVEVYMFMITDGGYGGDAWLRVDGANPGNLSVASNYAFTIYAGAYFDGKVYAVAPGGEEYGYKNHLMRIDAESGHLFGLMNGVYEDYDVGLYLVYSAIVEINLQEGRMNPYTWEEMQVGDLVIVQTYDGSDGIYRPGNLLVKGGYAYSVDTWYSGILSRVSMTWVWMISATPEAM